MFEALASVSDALASRTCSCGNEAERQFSNFALKAHAIDRSDWSLIAPLNDEGKPMTMKEAAKVVETRDVLPSRDAEREQKSKAVAMDRAKREAWREMSAERRIVVNGN